MSGTRSFRGHYERNHSGVEYKPKQQNRGQRTQPKQPTKEIRSESANSAFDKALEHRRGIRQCIKEIEVERDQLHNRIKEMDNFLAAYQKMVEL